MAKAVIIDSKIANTQSVSAKQYPISKATSIDHYSKITDIQNSSKILGESDYGIAKIIDIPLYVTAEQILPFRIKFTNIGIEGGYGPNNPAPIGIAVIGLNNYIL